MWLEDGPEPNIANLPKITNNKRLAGNSIKADEVKKEAEEISNLINEPTESTLNDDDLFESKETKEEPVKETPKTDIESNSNDEIDFGDDDDLFA